MLLLGQPIKTPAVIEDGLVTKDAVFDTTRYLVNTLGELPEEASQYEVFPKTPTSSFAGVAVGETRYLSFPNKKTAFAILALNKDGESLRATAKPARAAKPARTAASITESLRLFFEGLPLQTRVAFANALPQIRAAAERIWGHRTG